MGLLGKKKLSLDEILEGINNLSEEEELLNYYGTQALQSGKDNFGPTRHFHHVLSLEAEAWF